MYIDEFQSKFCDQIMNLILALKKSFLEFASDQRWVGWSRTVWHAQLFSHIRKVIAQRLLMQLKVELLTELLDSLATDFSNEL